MVRRTFLPFFSVDSHKMREMQLIRVRAPNGALRFELAGEQPVADLYAAVGEKMQLAPSAFALTRDQPGRETVPPLGAIAASGIKYDLFVC